MLTRRNPDDRINLSSNELIHPRLQGILRGAVETLDPDTLRAYPVSAPLVADIAARVGLEAREVLLTPGSDSAIRLILHHYAKRRGADANLLLQFPNYDAWLQVAPWLGLPVHAVASEACDPVEQGERLLAAARERHGSLIAVSVPNGPAGWCIPADHLDQLVDIAKARGHLLVIDACYQAFNGALTQQIGRRGEHVLVIQSLSKSHGLAGARLGLLCGSAAWMDELSESRLEHAVSGASMLLARHALDRHADFDNIWRDIVAARRQAAQEMELSGCRPLPSNANFLVLRLGSDQAAADVTHRLSAAGYRIRNLSTTPGFEGCIRFTIADMALTRQATAAICKAVSDGH
jgi:histidinol-phosphate aminotransferase